ncbi:MAG TPA: hypothetical protein VEV44_17125 [Pseudoneobacillus sp.]|nr:hypothetical protein [Pseudoneobacillus sp.]
METTTTLVSALSGVDFSVILDQVLAVLPIALPVVIAFVGFKKGLGFVMSRIKGA